MAKLKQIRVDDIVSLPVPIYRRWWQFWRPRILRYEQRDYRVTSSTTA